MTVHVEDEVAALVLDLDIGQVVHFTRSSGLLGIIASRAVLARSHLDESQYLEHVYRPNAKQRRDVRQLDYVNLSIERINTHFFRIARDKWYRDEEDISWCVLSFIPDILAHPGVLFATTNNMYTGAARAPGAAGLRALYAPQITQWAGKVVRRSDGMRKAWPTCRQAEVLYPDAVPLDCLKAIYVAEEADGDQIHGWLKTFGVKGVQVAVDTSAFT
jgi:hypothetical protein